MKKNYLINATILLSSLFVISCNDNSNKKAEDSAKPSSATSPDTKQSTIPDNKATPAPSASTGNEKTDFVYDAKKQYSVQIKTTMGDITLKLYGKESPKAVENFVRLVNKKYYDGIIFHRVINDFMIQTGDPTGTGRGGESIFGKEFENEDAPNLSYNRPGILGMANHGKNTNGSQFFITTAPYPSLDHGYTIFGEVSEGLDTVMAIQKVKTDQNDRPLQEVKMTKVSIVEFNVKKVNSKDSKAKSKEKVKH